MLSKKDARQEIERFVRMRDLFGRIFDRSRRPDPPQPKIRGRHEAHPLTIGEPQFRALVLGREARMSCVCGDDVRLLLADIGFQRMHAAVEAASNEQQRVEQGAHNPRPRTPQAQ